MNVSGSRDKTSYISVRTCQTHSIIRNFQSYLATGSAKIPYIVCVKTSKPDPTSTRKLSSMWFKAHSRGFELFVYWIFSEIGSKKLQPQENYPKDKMLKIICWMGHLCVRDHLDSNPIWKIPRRIVSFQERKLTYFNTFTFLSFFFLFDPTLVVFTRLFRCAFFLLMHLSMVCPRMGGPGNPRELDFVKRTWVGILTSTTVPGWEIWLDRHLDKWRGPGNEWVIRPFERVSRV